MVGETGNSIFAHSRSPKSFRSTPRLLPLYLSVILSDYRQKKPLKCYFLSCLLLLVTYHLSPLVTAVHVEPPNRIISLAPNLTEILFAMGLGDRIVGVTNFCDYPEDAKKKPKIGGMYNPSMEAVVSLRPDMVVMTTDGNLKQFEERLRSLGIKTYVFRARRLTELPQGIRDMGSTLGLKERANALASEIDIDFNRFRPENQKSNPFLSPLNSPLSKGGRLPAVGQESGGVKGEREKINKKKVLFIVWPEPLIVAASGTAIDDAISLLGCENIASKAYTSYPKYSVEEIIRQAPDVIFIGKGHADVKAASRKIIEKLSGIPAVRHGEVYYVSDSIYRLSPRIIKGIDEMARCLK
jgi:iron complex transport system substrate-binding protein